MEAVFCMLSCVSSSMRNLYVFILCNTLFPLAASKGASKPGHLVTVENWSRVLRVHRGRTAVPSAAHIFTSALFSNSIPVFQTMSHTSQPFPSTYPTYFLSRARQYNINSIINCVTMYIFEMSW